MQPSKWGNITVGMSQTVGTWNLLLRTLSLFLKDLLICNFCWVCMYLLSFLKGAHKKRRLDKHHKISLFLEWQYQGSILAPFLFPLSGLNPSEQLWIFWNGALIGLSYFNTGEYKWERKRRHAVALFDFFFSPPQSSSLPNEIFFPRD